MRRAAVAFLVATAAAAAGAQEPPHLVRFTSERAVLATGGHLTDECHTVLTAEVAPPSAGVRVELSIMAGTGAGRAVPAMLSSSAAATDARGIAQAFLVSGDAEEACRVLARGPAGAALELGVEFRRAPGGHVVVAPVPHAAAPARGAVGERVSILAEQLADPAVEVRTAAKRALVALGPDAVDALVGVAGDPRSGPDVRSLAVRALADVRDDQADDQLLELLGHPLPDVRSGAEDAIGRMAPARAEPLALAAVLAPAAAVRASGVRILVALATEEAGRSAIGMLGDGDPFVRATAVWELARAGSALAGDAVERALSDDSPFVRVAAATAVVLVGRRPDVDAARLGPALGRMCACPEPAVRAAAARALGVLETGSDTGLGGLFGDPDARVRRSVVLALPWRADLRSSVRLVRRFVGDADAVVRRTAVQMIAESGGEAEMDLLVGMLDAPEPEVVDRALCALRRVTCMDFGPVRDADDAGRAAALRDWRQWYASHGTGTRTEWLRQALEMPGSPLRATAALEMARALGPAGHDAESDRRRQALRSATARLLSEAGGVPDAARRAAAEALLLLGDAGGLDALAADAADPRDFARLAAVRAMDSALAGGAAAASADVGGRLVRALVDALEDPSVAVRRAAFRALAGHTGRSSAYRPEAPAEHRARAVAEWREWLARGP